MLHPRSMTSAINYLGVDGMETDFPSVLRALMPNYIATTSASPLSDAAAKVSWSQFPTNSTFSEVRVRGKPKATATWTNIVSGLVPHMRLVDAIRLRTNTLYEFQPIAYDAAGKPVGFGSISETATLPAGNNFTNAYAAWQTNYAGVGAPAANEDGDLYVNAVEYFLGLDPLSPATGADARPVVLRDNDELRLEYSARSGTFMKPSYEGSADLQTWSSLSEFSDYTIVIQPGNAGTEDVTVSIRLPNGAPHWFVRFRIEPVP
jgi:hypothetical protein